MLSISITPFNHGYFFKQALYPCESVHFKTWCVRPTIVCFYVNDVMCIRKHMPLLTCEPYGWFIAHIPLDLDHRVVSHRSHLQTLCECPQRSEIFIRTCCFGRTLVYYFDICYCDAARGYDHEHHRLE